MANQDGAQPELARVAAVRDFVRGARGDFARMGHSEFTEQGDDEIDDQGGAEDKARSVGDLGGSPDRKSDHEERGRTHERRLDQQVERKERTLPKIATLGLAKEEKAVYTATRSAKSPPITSSAGRSGSAQPATQPSCSPSSRAHQRPASVENPTKPIAPSRQP